MGNFRRIWISALVLAALGLPAGAQDPPAARPGARGGGRNIRDFLGLGAAPDAAAAERGEKLYAPNCAFCHGAKANGAEAPGQNGGLVADLGLDRIDHQNGRPLARIVSAAHHREVQQLWLGHAQPLQHRGADRLGWMAQREPQFGQTQHGAVLAAAGRKAKVIVHRNPSFTMMTDARGQP